MRSRRFVFVPVGVAVLLSFSGVVSNPIAPTQAFLLSEVQIVDPAHWTIELRCFPTQLSADTVTSRYYLEHAGVNPVYRPVITVRKNGYGLITPQQYPGVQIHPGDTIRLRQDTATGNQYQDSALYLWKCILDNNLKPTQSMAAYQWTYTDPLTLRNFPYIQWCRDASPTLGYANDSAGIFGTIRGFVCGNDNQPILNAVVLYGGGAPSILTNINGFFYRSNLISCQTLTVTLVGKSFGPFSSEPDCTTSVICKLDSASMLNVGTLRGFACDKDSQPLINSWILFRYSSPAIQGEIFTDSSGHFILSLLPATTQVFLSVGDMISGPQDYGPFSITPGCTTSVICRTPPPVSAHATVIPSPISSLKIVGITKTKTSAIIVFSGGEGTGNYNVDIYSLSGKKVFSSMVSTNGTGTYSVNWNTGLHAGTYIARLRSQSTSIEKRFTIK